MFMLLVCGEARHPVVNYSNCKSKQNIPKNNAVRTMARLKRYWSTKVIWEILVHGY